MKVKDIPKETIIEIMECCSTHPACNDCPYHAYYNETYSDYECVFKSTPALFESAYEFKLTCEFVSAKDYKRVRIKLKLDKI